ncbi:MAG TPA: hypothetical protein VET24_04990 [Actinomycetota bacterium]|nr:hypothetical protein [Actinomycetota bacterium]
MTAGQWGWIARSDDWKRVYAGIYRRVGAPVTWEQSLMAGCLSADAIASHRAAGVLWRLPEIEPRLEIVIPEHRRVALQGFEIHRTAHLDRVDRTHRSGIPVTSLARTVIDVSLEVPRLAPVLVDHVLARRKVPLALLENRLSSLGTRGRRSAGELVAMLEERRGRKRHVDSGLQREFEQIALDAYKAGRLPKPHFEYPVRLSDGTWRYPDVAFTHVDIGFEAHSYEHHSTLTAFARDAERNLALFGEGWIIVMVTAVQIRNPVRLVALMARIIAAAEARRR